MSEQFEIRREPVGGGAKPALFTSDDMPPAEQLDDSGHAASVAQGDQTRVAASSSPNAPKRRGRRAKDVMHSVPAVPGDAHSDGGGLWDDVPHCPLAPSSELHAQTVAELVALSRRRGQWMKSILKLVLQEQAILRDYCGGDKDAARAMWKRVVEGNGEPVAVMAIGPLIEARCGIEGHLAPVERHMVKLARKLPAYDWVKSVHGFGDMGFALIIGNTGDLSNYANPAKVWKRLGLAVINGERQRKMSDAELAAEHGYSPPRRSMMWNVGNGIIGGMGRGKRPLVGEDVDARDDWHPYEKLFVHRLRREVEKDPSHARPETKDGKESYSKHAANRAKRYVEKRVLRDLWREWRRAINGTPTIFCLPDAAPSPQGDAPGLKLADTQLNGAGGTHSAQAEPQATDHVEPKGFLPAATPSAEEAGPTTILQLHPTSLMSSADPSPQGGHPASLRPTPTGAMPDADIPAFLRRT